MLVLGIFIGICLTFLVSLTTAWFALRHMHKVDKKTRM